MCSMKITRDEIDKVRQKMAFPIMCKWSKKGFFNICFLQIMWWTWLVCTSANITGRRATVQHGKKFLIWFPLDCHWSCWSIQPLWLIPIREHFQLLRTIIIHIFYDFHRASSFLISSLAKHFSQTWPHAVVVIFQGDPLHHAVMILLSVVVILTLTITANSSVTLCATPPHIFTEIIYSIVFGDAATAEATESDLPYCQFVGTKRTLHCTQMLFQTE